MHRVIRAVCLVCLLPAGVGLAQESLCEPCVDPPLNRTLSPALEPGFTPSDEGFDLGASISRLRQLEATPGPRALTLIDSVRVLEDPSAATADESASAVTEDQGPEGGEQGPPGSAAGNALSPREPLEPPEPPAPPRE